MAEYAGPISRYGGTSGPKDWGNLTMADKGILGPYRIRPLPLVPGVDVNKYRGVPSLPPTNWNMPTAPAKTFNSNDLRRAGATEAEIDIARNRHRDLSRVPLSVFKAPALPWNPPVPTTRTSALTPVNYQNLVDNSSYMTRMHPSVSQVPALTPVVDKPFNLLDSAAKITSGLGLTGKVPFAGPAGLVLGMGEAGREATRQQNRLTAMGIDPTLPGHNVSGLQAMGSSLGVGPWIPSPFSNTKYRMNLFGSNNNVIPGLGWADTAKQQAQDIEDQRASRQQLWEEMQDRQFNIENPAPTVWDIMGADYGMADPTNPETINPNPRRDRPSELEEYNMMYNTPISGTALAPPEGSEELKLSAPYGNMFGGDTISNSVATFFNNQELSELDNRSGDAWNELSAQVQAEGGGYNEQVDAAAAAVASAQGQPAPPSVSIDDSTGGDDGGDDGGTVICTELHRQGKLCDEWFKVDKKVGQWFAKHDPDVMTGYHFWGKPLARLMKKSSFITYLVSLLALPWAKEMYIQQGNNEIGTFRGMFLYKLGLPICRIIGKAINSGKVHYVKSN